MPRLPDVTSFGGRPALQGRDGVPSTNNSGVRQAASIFARSAQDQAAGTADLGKSVFEAGEIMFAGAMRERERLDAVDRARAVEQLSEQGQEMFRNLGTMGDWSDPQTLTTYREQVNAMSRNIVEGHGGSADSSARLAERVEQQRAALIEAGNKAAFDAGQKVVVTRHAKDLNSLIARVYADPSSLVNGLVALDAQLKDIAPVLERDQEDAIRQEGRREISVAALTSMIDRRQVDEAEKIMLENETIRTTLGLADLNRLFDRISTIRMEKAQGFTLSPGSIRFDEQGNIIASAPATAQQTSPSDVIGPILAKMAAGQPLTPGQTQALEFYQRLDPINRLIAASLGSRMGATDEFTPPAENKAPGNASPVVPNASTSTGEGLTPDQQADLQNAQAAIAKGADENAVRKRIEDAGDQRLIHEFDRWNVMRKRQ